MAKKQFFMILDTETTIDSTVADIGAIIVDRKGEIFAEMAVLIAGEFGTKPLFYDQNAADIWGLAGLERRTKNYQKMLDSGSRVMASVNAVNRWIDKAITTYNPELTAYNLAFDVDKCQNTGIDLNGFTSRFCLWQAALGSICNSKKYRDFCLKNHLFNNRTPFGNMTVKTSAESVYSFITGDFTPEPHTGLEDAKQYELPILLKVLKARKWREKMTAYNWRANQVKDFYTVK